MLSYINICVNVRGMVYAEFISRLERIGLTVRGFAELIGMNPNSISNYARKGELPSHLALIAVLVVAVGEMGGDYRHIISSVGVTPKKPRGSGRRGQFGGDRQTRLELER